MIDSRLMNLLSENRANPLVADCLEQISQASEIRYRGDGGAQLNQIIDTYVVRARINSELNNGVVEGFDALLPALKAAAGASVKVHSLEVVSHWYMVFTDESIADLFGILKSPKKKAAWFDPVKGYDE